MEALLESNAALKNELAGMDKDKAAEALRKMDIAELLTGLAVGGKNQKDMASYKFWQTQPVPRFDEAANDAGGPIKIIDPEKVSKTPDALIEGFEWATLDLTNDDELQELWDLLTYHYVEDDNAMFRFRYSKSFLHWLVHAIMLSAHVTDCNGFQGFDVSGLEEGMARRCPRQQVKEIGCFDLRCPNGGSRS